MKSHTIVKELTTLDLSSSDVIDCFFLELTSGEKHEEKYNVIELSYSDMRKLVKFINKVLK